MHMLTWRHACMCTQIHVEKEPELGIQNLQCSVVCTLTANQKLPLVILVHRPRAFLNMLFFFQTLNQMFIVNAGSGFKLIWNTAKGFLDPRTTAKINVYIFLFLLWFTFRKEWQESKWFMLDLQVLGNKFQSRLLEVIDARFLLFLYCLS